MKLIWIIAVTILGMVNAQTFSFGNCNPNLETIKNFDKIKWTGKWYEIKRGFNILEDGKKCNIYNHMLSSTKDHVYEVEYSFAIKDQGNKINSVILSVDAEDLSTGKLKFMPGPISDEQPLWVLDSDYENYMVLYSCLNVYKGKAEWVWIHSLKTNPDASYIAISEKVLKDRNINVELITEEHTCE